MEFNLHAAISLALMNRLERILLLIAASTLLTEAAFAQGTTITSLNTTDTPGTPVTVTVAGANGAEFVRRPNFDAQLLRRHQIVVQLLTSQGTFAAIQVGAIGNTAP